MTRSDPEPRHRANPLAALLGMAACLALGYLALSQKLPAPPPELAGSVQPRLRDCVMDRAGYWRGQIFGTTALQVDWQGSRLACAGNSRPDGQGLRLFFAGHPAGTADRLLLVIGIPADISRAAGREHEASVTLIDETSSLIFHSDAGRCFTQVNEVSRLVGENDAYRVDGELYCVGAIAAVGTEGSVTLGDTRYSGRLVLEAP